MFELCNTTLAQSTSYHPQSDGKVERMNRTINQMMRALIDENQADWTDQLWAIQYAINSTPSTATGMSPFELLYVVQPRAIPLLALPSTHASADFLGEAVDRILRARDELITQRVWKTTQANKHRHPSNVFGSALTVGKAVWVSSANFSVVSDKARKWAPKFLGPFKVLAIDKDIDVLTLALPERYTIRGISNKFHISKVKPYYASDESQFPQRITAHTPVFPIDSMVDISIKSVIGHRVEDDGIKAYVWRAVRENSPKEPDWVPFDQLPHDAKLNYYAKVSRQYGTEIKDVADLNKDNSLVHESLASKPPSTDHMRTAAVSSYRQSNPQTRLGSRYTNRSEVKRFSGQSFKVLNSPQGQPLREKQHSSGRQIFRSGKRTVETVNHRFANHSAGGSTPPGGTSPSRKAFYSPSSTQASSHGNWPDTRPRQGRHQPCRTGSPIGSRKGISRKGFFNQSLPGSISSRRFRHDSTRTSSSCRLNQY